MPFPQLEVHQGRKTCQWFGRCWEWSPYHSMPWGWSGAADAASKLWDFSKCSWCWWTTTIDSLLCNKTWNNLIDTRLPKNIRLMMTWLMLNSHATVSEYLYSAIWYIYICILSYFSNTIEPRFNDVCRHRADWKEINHKTLKNTRSSNKIQPRGIFFWIWEDGA